MYQPNHLTTKFRLIALLIAFSLFFYAFSLRHEVKAQAPNSPPALGFIGEFYPSNEIRIESQDYIDKYFDWQFTEINSTHWQANFSFKDFFYLDAKPLIYQVLPIEEDAIAFCEKYFSDYLNCSIDYYKPWRDLRNMSKYPLINLTYGITFSNYTYDNKTGKASFYIVFPEGFKEGEMAKLGFHSTVISTGRTTPFYPTRRNICKDGAGILHVVWLYNSTTIRYANSSDGVTWRVNETF
jgi:hypothetical protein